MTAVGTQLLEVHCRSAVECEGDGVEEGTEEEKKELGNIPVEDGSQVQYLAEQREIDYHEEKGG